MESWETDFGSHQSYCSLASSVKYLNELMLIKVAKLYDHLQLAAVLASDVQQLDLVRFFFGD
jgi:hypothetical protein